MLCIHFTELGCRWLSGYFLIWSCLETRTLVHVTGILKGSLLSPLKSSVTLNIRAQREEVCVFAFTDIEIQPHIWLSLHCHGSFWMGRMERNAWNVKHSIGKSVGKDAACETPSKRKWLHDNLFLNLYSPLLDFKGCCFLICFYRCGFFLMVCWQVLSFFFLFFSCRCFCLWHFSYHITSLYFSLLGSLFNQLCSGQMLRQLLLFSILLVLL